MTTRTLVSYLVSLWSKLGIGVAKDKITLSPSALEPAIPAQKNCGALSPNIEFLQGIENTKSAQWFNSGMQNAYDQRDQRLSEHLYAKANYQAVADHYENKDKFKKQIAAFAQLKAKRKSRVTQRAKIN